MDDGLTQLEEKVMDEYLALVQRVQPELGRHLFYDVMPAWEDFRAYRLEELVHQNERDKVM